MSDEPTERDVETLADVLWRNYGNLTDCRAEARTIFASDWYAERIAEARREGAAEVAARVEATADDWQRELDSGAIRDEDARYCWMLAAREVRAALRDTP